MVIIKEVTKELKDMFYFFKNYNELYVFINTIFFILINITLYFFKDNINDLLVIITDLFLIYFLMKTYQTMISFSLAKSLFIAKDDQKIIIDNNKRTSLIIAIPLNIMEKIFLKIFSCIYDPSEHNIHKYLEKIIIFNKKYSKNDILGMSRNELLMNFNFHVEIIDFRLRLIIPQFDSTECCFIDRSNLLDIAS